MYAPDMIQFRTIYRWNLSVTEFSVLRCVRVYNNAYYVGITFSLTMVIFFTSVW